MQKSDDQKSNPRSITFASDIPCLDNQLLKTDGVDSIEHYIYESFIRHEGSTNREK